MTLTKLDVARRQLETACWLYFHDGDPVSIHNLTLDSHEILRNILKKSGEKTIFKDAVAEWAKEEYRKEIVEIINKPQNFFKHADRDPEDSLDFNPKSTEFFLFEASGICQNLREEQIPYLYCFQVWFLLHHHDKFIPDGVFQAELIKQQFVQLKSLSRQVFFTDVLAISGTTPHSLFSSG